MDARNVDSFTRHLYLLGQLSGVAHTAIELYPPSALNYDRAVAVLKERFGNEQALVEALQSELTALPKASDSPSSLRKLMESVVRICEQLIDYGEQADNKFVLSAIKAKLPRSVLEEMVVKQRQSGVPWSYWEYQAHLTELVAVREEVQRCSAVQPAEPKTQRQDKQSKRDNRQAERAFPAIQPTQPQQPQPRFNRFGCSLCDGDNHRPSKCPRYNTAKKRLARLREQNRCTNCLRQGHSVSQCEDSRRCNTCQQKHNYLVCFKAEAEAAKGTSAPDKPNPAEDKPKGRSGAAQPTSSKQTTAPARSGEKKDSAGVALTTVPSVLIPSEVSLVTKATQPSAFLMTLSIPAKSPRNSNVPIPLLNVYDSCCHRSFIKTSVSRQLRLPKVTTEMVEISGFGGGNVHRFRSPLVKLKLQRKDGGWEEVLLNECDNLVEQFQTISWDNTCSPDIPEEVQQAITYATQEPDIILGIRHFWAFFEAKRQIGKNLYLIDTCFGSVPCGELQASILQNPAVSLISVHPSNPDSSCMSEDSMEKFWDLESLGVTDSPQSDDDRAALEMTEKSIRQDASGRYYVGWPWKSPEAKATLPSNFHLSYQRLSWLLQRLRKSPEVFDAYAKKIDEQLEKGIIEVAKHTPDSVEHYLPHQAVITHKLRVVYDASAHAKGQQSLNSHLHRGPVYLPNLVGMLLRFRADEVPVLADVEGAFLAVGLHEPDREVVKFLWLKDLNSPLSPNNMVVYRFTRVCFGVISSPFLLAAVIRHHCRKVGTPLSLSIIDNTYVDNTKLGCSSEEEAKVQCREAKEVFQGAQMNLREYCSHKKEVMDALPPEDRLDKPIPKVLGVKWKLEDDTLIIVFPTPPPDTKCTPRVVLSTLASCFDPIGLLSPCILPAKLLFQALWKREGESDSPALKWDDKLPAQLEQKWLQLMDQWKDQSIILPRQNVPLNAFPYNCMPSLMRQMRHMQQLCTFAWTPTKVFSPVWPSQRADSVRSNPAPK